MKQIILVICVIGLISFGCKQNKKTTETTDNIKSEITQASETSNRNQEILDLIRQVLSWSDSERNIDFLPVVPDNNYSLYVGFNIEQHKENLEKLKQTNLFSYAFIENYNQIILTLDRKLKNKEFADWLVGEMPPFNFYSGVNPWCLCQDNLDWESVDVEIITLDKDKGELNWKWGNLKPEYDPSWKDFSYRFRVEKEENIWKISYLQGFDFEECIK